jgi:hypothetical protein
MNFGPIEIDTNDPMGVFAQYNSAYNQQYTQSQRNYAWFQSRLKLLGYKSVAQFRRDNPDLSVTASTLSNYFRYGTMPLWVVPRLCYALKVSPNTFLSILGYYEPARQQEIPLITQ